VVTDFCGTNAVVSVDALHRWRVMAAQKDMKVGEANYKYLLANGNRARDPPLAEKCKAAVLDPAAPGPTFCPPTSSSIRRGGRSWTTS